jgi:hypothetical protein
MVKAGRLSVGIIISLLSVVLYVTPALCGSPVLSAGKGGLPVATVGGPQEVLYDQTDSASGNGAPDQAFESDNSAYDCEGADDFEVTDALGWLVKKINTVGTEEVSPGGIQWVTVVFYPDNSGWPGTTAVATYVVAGASVTDNSGSLEIPIDPPLQLPAGHFWVVIQVRQDFVSYGQHFWSNRSVQSFNESVWRNPNGGFGIGCTDWGRQMACGVGGGASPDFLFQIVGERIKQQVPTLTSWGLVLGALLFVVSGSYFVYRRRAAA